MTTDVDDYIMKLNLEHGKITETYLISFEE